MRPTYMATMPNSATTVIISISVKPLRRTALQPFMVEPHARDRVLARRAVELGPLHAHVDAARAARVDVDDLPRGAVGLLGLVGRTLDHLVGHESRGPGRR